MTEQEWLNCTDPTPMLEFLGGKTSERKMRLFAVACCQQYQTYFTDERSWAAVEVAAQLADGAVGEDERERAFVEAYSAANWTYDSDDAAEIAAYACGNRAQVDDVPWRAMHAFAFDIYQSPRHLTRFLLHDLFGTLLFRPVTADLSWLTSTVVQLGAGIYTGRAFDHLPILADALQDAGCDNADVLNHCRSDGPHIRGCWVVDLLLGKE